MQITDCSHIGKNWKLKELVLRKKSKFETWIQCLKNNLKIILREPTYMVNFFSISGPIGYQKKWYHPTLVRTRMVLWLLLFRNPADVSWSNNRWAERTGIAVTGKSWHFSYWKERTTQGKTLLVEGRLIEIFLLSESTEQKVFSVFVSHVTKNKSLQTGGTLENKM